MKNPIDHFGFDPENYRLMFIGLAINVLGYILMIGGGADDPSQFDGDALFSHVRITLAPMLIVIGYGIMIYAIMKKPKKDENQESSDSTSAKNSNKK